MGTERKVQAIFEISDQTNVILTGISIFREKQIRVFKMSHGARMDNWISF